MNKDSDPVAFLKAHCDFRVGPYVLMAIARKTHNDDVTNNTEPVYREVLHSPSQAERAYHDVRHRIDIRPYEWRVYVTTNARDPQTAYFNFRDRMNDWSQRLLEGDGAAEQKIGHVASEWVSELHRPESAAQSLFTFDLDDVTRQDANRFAEEVPATVHIRRATPNGYHIVTDPFEYPAWTPPVDYDDLDTDGQLHVTKRIGKP